ncbi:hypothetical protein M8494_09235 [Serratia ureilytica]
MRDARQLQKTDISARPLAEKGFSPCSMKRGEEFSYRIQQHPPVRLTVAA